MVEVYGCKISYYTGKLETYLRYRSIPYVNHPTVGNQKRLRAQTGVSQMPVVRIEDGRWATDTTPLIAWFESQRLDGSIYPSQPVMAFLAHLIEDYADEWLWRPAMHYRWSYRADRCHAAEAIYQDQMAGTSRIPRWVGIPFLKARQFLGFVRGDGVRRESRAHVDSTYLAAISHLQRILDTRPFVLGACPTLADFGLMGPMLRHFGQDPTPAEIMRTCAPAVYEWVARMWNGKSDEVLGGELTSLDRPLLDFVREISETHLAQLRQNAEAYSRGVSRYDLRIQGVRYARVPTSRYRVWCLEMLRREWDRLDPANQGVLRDAIGEGEFDVLSDEGDYASSNYDVEGLAPFNRAIHVFGSGVPSWFRRSI
ncbi:glutathione S-transferase C-terminal domain-containing protein [Myxococcota bacterium]|nr:glutathione S-transferase C-terminal domain-containing protein [Myxococcota bacterium]